MYLSQDESLPFATIIGPDPSFNVCRFLQTGQDLLDYTGSYQYNFERTFEH